MLVNRNCTYSEIDRRNPLLSRTVDITMCKIIIFPVVLCGFETLSLSLGEGHKWQTSVCENICAKKR